MIRRGIPSIVVVTERFLSLAKSTCRAQGFPDAPMILLPRSEDIEYAGPEAMDSAADTVLQGFLAQFIAQSNPEVRA